MGDWQLSLGRGARGGKRGGCRMIRTAVLGLVCLWVAGAAWAATTRSYRDVDGEEWRVCLDESGYVVRHVASGDTHTWGSGYRWAEIEEGHRLVPPPLRTESSTGGCRAARVSSAQGSGAGDGQQGGREVMRGETRGVTRGRGAASLWASRRSEKAL